MAIQGNLQEMSVLEAVQLIGTQRKDATLKIETDLEEVQLHFQEGALVASHRKGMGRGEPFLEAMVALAHLTPAEAMKISSQIMEDGRDLWRVVQEIDHLTSETSERVYMQVTEATIDRVLLWERGHFAVLPRLRVDSVFTPGLSVDSILLDAMRRLDELASWKQRDFPKGSIPCISGPEELYVSSDPLRRAIIKQIDGRRTIDQVVDATNLGEYEIYTTLSEGIEEGWIQILAPSSKKSSSPAPAREVLKRWPAFLVLASLLLLTVTTAWIGHRLEPVSGPWETTKARWQELDLHRSIEAYRYRHGHYPDDLAAVEADDLPAGDSIEQRWNYERKNRSYVLTLR